jgi:hypothetical protein
MEHILVHQELRELLEQVEVMEQTELREHLVQVD